MPVGIQQPSNQIKLTNVSLVRMKKGKKRFEIACYKNKVLEYRQGLETDLDNVLQIPNVFLNVSKGQVAPHDDLKKAFGDKKVEEIVLDILKKGELQVGEGERKAQLEQLHNEVIDIVAGKLVDPKTKRVYTTGMIDKALDQISSTSAKQPGAHHKGTPSNNTPAGSGPSTPATGENGEAKPQKEQQKAMWTGVVTTRSAKSQALDAMKALIAHQIIPVARARMRLRITCPTSISKQAVKSAPKAKAKDEGEDNAQKATGTVKDQILSYVEEVESQDVLGEEWEVVGFVEPGAYKLLTELIGTQTKGRARAEVLDMAVVHEDN